MRRIKNKTLPDYRRSSGIRIFFSIFGVVVLILFISGIYSALHRIGGRVTADYYYPFLKILHKAEGMSGDQRLLALSKWQLSKLASELQRSCLILSASQETSAELRKENSALRTILKLKKKEKFIPVFAEVMQRDPMTWQEQFILDKGKRNGVAEGNLVVTVVPVLKDGHLYPSTVVAGKVKTVFGHSCLVSTILSQDFKMSVSLPGAKVSGILEGIRHTSDLHALLRFLPLGVSIEKGNIVYTNNYSGQEPAGIAVGTVFSPYQEQLSQSGHQLYKEVCIKPLVSPAEVRFAVIYVKDTP